ncbi:MAG TPA: class I SAM-dependent methyltransferase [Kofleriaceae bacterium]
MTHQLHEQNRRSWNHATRAHNQHKGDQAAFLRGGGSTLFPEELGLLGDLHERRVVHLQCNSGQDSLSIAARGAQVTGVDISDEAIEFARKLSSGSGITAQFERADVYDWLATTTATFDIVFASYGALCWLSDLPTWARGVARVLAPGGRLVVVEFHPLLNLFDDSGRVTTDLMKGGGGGHIEWKPGVGDYVAASEGALPAGEHIASTQPYENPEPSHEWEWSVPDVIDAVAQAGLRIERVREWPYSNGCRFFPSMVALDGKRWALSPDAPKVPCMYGLVASRDRPNAGP